MLYCVCSSSSSRGGSSCAHNNNNSTRGLGNWYHREKMQKIYTKQVEEDCRMLPKPHITAPEACHNVTLQS